MRASRPCRAKRRPCEQTRGHSPRDGGPDGVKPEAGPDRPPPIPNGCAPVNRACRAHRGESRLAPRWRMMDTYRDGGPDGVKPEAGLYSGVARARGGPPATRSVSRSLGSALRRPAELSLDALPDHRRFGGHAFNLAPYQASRTRSPFNRRLFARRNLPGEMFVPAGVTHHSKPPRGSPPRTSRTNCAGRSAGSSASRRE
jgi:hypothetical protein